jgi:fatty acid desaturase
MNEPDRSLTADHLRHIRAALPAGAFRPDPWKLLPLMLHAHVVVGAHFAVSRVGLSPWLALPIVVASVALSCIGFHAHDLAHGSIVRPGRLQRVAELFFWGLLTIAPTVWRRVHNHAHHSHYNTAADPDRPFFAEEASPATRWYTRLLYPNDEVFPWNPLVFLHLVPYIARNTLAALLPARWKPVIVPRRAAYLDGEAAVILGELALIAVLQAALFFISGGRWLPYLIMLFGTQALTSAVTMSYIFTNHFINPMSDEPDPIRGTTSVIVPAWLDRLHANFSYHTEHHLFPALNSSHYPQVSRVLAELFPTTYQRIPIAEAWRRLWRTPPFVAREAFGAAAEIPAPRALMAVSDSGARSGTDLLVEADGR